MSSESTPSVHQQVLIYLWKGFNIPVIPSLIKLNGTDITHVLDNYTRLCAIKLEKRCEFLYFAIITNNARRIRQGLLQLLIFIGLGQEHIHYKVKRKVDYFYGKQISPRILNSF